MADCQPLTLFIRAHPRDCTNDEFRFENFYYRSQQETQDIQRKWANLQCNRKICDTQSGRKYYTDLIKE